MSWPWTGPLSEGDVRDEPDLVAFESSADRESDSNRGSIDASRVLSVWMSMLRLAITWSCGCCCSCCCCEGKGGGAGAASTKGEGGGDKEDSRADWRRIMARRRRKKSDSQRGCGWFRAI